LPDLFAGAPVHPRVCAAGEGQVWPGGLVVTASARPVPDNCGNTVIGRYGSPGDQ